MGRFRKLTSRKNDHWQWLDAYQSDDISLTRFFVPWRLKPHLDRAGGKSAGIGEQNTGQS